MNGQPLPVAHGYPLRLIVPAWYGVASVKWLAEIELTGRASSGYVQADRYHIGGHPLARQAARSVITWTQTGKAVAPGLVRSEPITQVEVRVGGRTWQTATFTGDRHPHVWRSWHLPARLEEPGNVIIRPGPPTSPAEASLPSQPGTRSATPLTSSTKSGSMSESPRITSVRARLRRTGRASDYHS